jgi:[ribosomal protein S5]-alanine N-acetyltransferase
MTLLKTPRLAIRELAPSDGATILAFANDDSINRYLGFGSISSESGTNEYINKAIASAARKPRHNYKLAMTITPSDELSGSCWLDIEDPESKNASIGYFVDKKHWGNGYATEMIKTLIQFGFGELHLHRIYAHCDAENLATHRVLEKVGMLQEGVLREHCLRNYGWADICYYGMLRSEWASTLPGDVMSPAHF